jgi:hypothetical protein
VRVPFIPEHFGALGQGVKDWMTQVTNLLRGYLTLHDNLNKQVISYTSNATPNTEDSIDITSLGLTWAPTYFLVLAVNKDGAVVRASGTWSNTTIKAKCNVASTTATLWVL